MFLADDTYQTTHTSAIRQCPIEPIDHREPIGIIFTRLPVATDHYQVPYMSSSRTSSCDSDSLTRGHYSPR